MDDIHQQVLSAIKALKVFAANGNPQAEIAERTLIVGACGLVLDESQGHILGSASKLLRQRSPYLTDAEKAVNTGAEIGALAYLTDNPEYKKAVLSNMLKGQTPDVIRSLELDQYITQQSVVLMRNGQTDRVAYLVDTLRPLPLRSPVHAIHNALNKRVNALVMDNEYEVMENMARALTRRNCVAEICDMLDHSAFSYVLSNPPPQNDGFSRQWNKLTDRLVFEMTGVYLNSSNLELFQESRETKTQRRIVGYGEACISSALKERRYDLIEAHAREQGKTCMTALSRVLKGALVRLCAEGDYDPALQFLERAKDSTEKSVLVFSKSCLSNMACVLHMQQTETAANALAQLTTVASHFDTRKPLWQIGSYWYQHSWSDCVQDGIQRAVANSTQRMGEPTAGPVKTQDKLKL